MVILEGGVPESCKILRPRISSLDTASSHHGSVAEAVDRIAVAGTVVAVLERISSVTCSTCHVYRENCHYRGSKTDSTHRIPPTVNDQEPQLNLIKSIS